MARIDTWIPPIGPCQRARSSDWSSLCPSLDWSMSGRPAGPLIGPYRHTTPFDWPPSTHGSLRVARIGPC
eukprot:1061687-Prorocentrum_minimum.AAC.1